MELVNIAANKENLMNFLLKTNEFPFRNAISHDSYNPIAVNIMRNGKIGSKNLCNFVF